MEPRASRVNLLDTWIDRIDLKEACDAIDSYVRDGVPKQVVTVNLDFLRIASRDRSFREIVNGAAMVVPDGMPLVWASRLQGESMPERVAGVDLVCECARLARDRGYSIFLLGAGPRVADRAASILCDRFPGLQIAGTYSPPSTSAEDDQISVARIRMARPDIVFVAFGAPRQELWICKHMYDLNVPVCVGVGGSFDMISGRVRRAPMFMQRWGLEWVYRFAMEPKRLWKRYFVQDLPMMVRLISWCTDPEGPRVQVPVPFSSRISTDNPTAAFVGR